MSPGALGFFYPEEAMSISTRNRVPVGDGARRLGFVANPIDRRIEHKGMPAHDIVRLWKCKLSEVEA